MATSRIEGTATLQNAEQPTHEVVALQIVVLDVDLERHVQPVITREAEGLHPLGIDVLLDDSGLALFPVQIQESTRVARACVR